MTDTDAQQFLTDIIGQLFHADMLITEQVERIELLEDEVARLKAALEKISGAAA